ncbi:hypothetical protein QBC47DRAFT_412890 [Echria macrotheca]|uniref:Uncharacterized protein n=1 Tax=Echria macrotheca TaxID=438768 RepID=A0AAJ0BGE3_9PEZI|nr:hypothetical protein QBC47DRAFT_412890 [Echria macrotheca]
MEKSPEITNIQTLNDERPPTLETPKIVSSSRKRDALLTAAVYHLFPVLITALYTVTYAQQWTWPHPGPSQEVMAALQFVAKIHECAVIASLANIFYHRIRYLMIQADGVPLGLITSPFQTGNPLYFVSPEFLGTLRALLSTRSNFITFALLGLVAVLSTAANPISAIILIPRKMVFLMPQSHWLMQGLKGIMAPDGRPTTQDRIYGSHAPNLKALFLLQTLSIPTQKLYPTSMGPELGVTWTCPEIPDRPGNCVSLFQDLFPELFLKLLGGQSDTYSDIPDPNDILDSRRKKEFTVMGSNMAAISMQFSIEGGAVPDTAANWLSRVTCPLQLTAYMLGEPNLGLMEVMENHTDPGDQLELITSLSFEGENESLPSRQPQVLVQECKLTINTRNLSVAVLTSFDWANWQDAAHGRAITGCFGAGFYPSFPFKMTDKIAELLMKQDWTRGFAVFVDLQDQIPFPISGAYIATASPYSPQAPGEQGWVRLAIGYFVASWAEAGLSSRRFSPSIPEQPILPGELSNPFYTLINRTEVSGESLVHMDANWLNSLDIFPFEVVPVGVLPSLSNESRSLFAQLPNMDMEPSADSFGAIVAAVMSAAQLEYNAFGLQTEVCAAPRSRGCASSTSWRNASSPLPIVYNFAHEIVGDAANLPENQIGVRLKIEYEAYGYQFQGVTILLSFLFLYLHVFLVVGHVLVIVTGGFWNSRAWGSLADLVVLGIGSRPSDLVENTGSGVKSWRTWALTVSVRNVRKDHRLELVLCDPARDEYRGKLGTVKPVTDVKYS